MTPKNKEIEAIIQSMFNFDISFQDLVDEYTERKINEYAKETEE
jgi:uncharacterized membrane-anchored protein YitT (DUF2179 family)